MSAPCASARAKESSWRWPAEKLLPRSRTGVSKPPGSRRTKASACTASRDAPHVLGSDLRPLQRDVLGDAAAEQEHVLQHHRHAPAQLRDCGQSRMSTPSIRMRPRRTS